MTFSLSRVTLTLHSHCGPNPSSTGSACCSRSFLAPQAQLSEFRPSASASALASFPGPDAPTCPAWKSLKPHGQEPARGSLHLRSPGGLLLLQCIFLTCSPHDRVQLQGPPLLPGVPSCDVTLTAFPSLTQLCINSLTKASLSSRWCYSAACSRQGTLA